MSAQEPRIRPSEAPGAIFGPPSVTQEPTGPELGPSGIVVRGSIDAYLDDHLRDFRSRLQVLDLGGVPNMPAAMRRDLAA